MRAAEDSRARPAPVRTRHIIPRAKQCVRVCEPGRERCGARCHRWSDGARQQPHNPTCPRDRMRQRRRRRAGGYCADLEASEHRASTRASLPLSPPTQPHGAPPGRARPCARGGLTSRLTASASPEPVVPARGYVSALSNITCLPPGMARGGAVSLSPEPSALGLTGRPTTATQVTL